MTYEERTIKIAQWMLDNEGTIRSAAKHFGLSKSVVGRDIKVRLPTLDPDLTQRLDVLLDKNYYERTYRGGLATRRKYRGDFD